AMSPLTFFDVRSGVRSSVNYITRHRGSLYAATGGGFLRMVPSVRGMPATWEPVRGAQEQTMVCLSTADRLMGGGTKGLYEIRGDQAKFIHPANYVFQLSRSRRDPSLIYAAQGDGLVLIRRVAGHWTAVNQAPEAIAQITSFDEDADGRFWMGTLPHGVRRIDTRRQPPLVEKFGMAHGLPKGAVYTANFGGRIVFLTTKGLYRFEESGRFVPDSFLGAMFADGRREISLLSQDLSGNG